MILIPKMLADLKPILLYHTFLKVTILVPKETRLYYKLVFVKFFCEASIPDNFKIITFAYVIMLIKHACVTDKSTYEIAGNLNSIFRDFFNSFEDSLLFSWSKDLRIFCLETLPLVFVGVLE